MKRDPTIPDNEKEPPRGAPNKEDKLALTIAEKYKTPHNQ